MTNSKGITAIVLVMLIFSSITALSQAPPVGDDTVATGISKQDVKSIRIWSYRSNVFVDLSQVSIQSAYIFIYNLEGQCIYASMARSATVLGHELDNTNHGYIIVKVYYEGEMITRKLFISN